MFLTNIPSKCKAYYKSLNILHTHETFSQSWCFYNVNVSIAIFNYFLFFFTFYRVL